MPESKAKVEQKPEKPLIFIDQQGRVINKENPQQGRTGFNYRKHSEEMFGRKPAGEPTSAGDVAAETFDRAVDFVIIDDLLNGGKEVNSILNGAKNIFKGAEEVGGSAIDDVVGAGIADGTGADIIGGVAEHSSGIMDTLSGIFDSAADGLSGIGDALGDAVGGIIDSAI